MGQAKLRRIALPRDLAMQHFDNFYSKVYGTTWPSIRLGLLCQNKYSCIVNTFSSPEETIKMLEEEHKCIDLGLYYKRHQKKSLRYQMRMKILKEKKEKKLAYMAAELGVDPVSIDPETVVVSDVSDSELKSEMRDRGFSSGTGTEAEDFVEMFQTEVEAEEEKLFINPASPLISLNDFVPPTEMKYREEVKEGDTKYYSFYQSEIDVPVEIIREDSIEFPEHFKAFTFSRRCLTDFPKPRIAPGINVFNYYCMDGASLLPPLVLGIKPKDTVADVCSAPGGKALAMAMTFLPSNILCNDVSIARMSRLQNVLKSYIPKMDITNEMIELRQGDGKSLTGCFDKILLDVPCTNDRKSCTSDENNIFKTSRLNERVELPTLQCDLLFNGFRCLKPGGSLVYSTCSLSPIQNDGVVHMTLKRLREETDIRVCVIDLKEALRPLRGLFRFHRQMKYGQQVLPFLPSNFGPMYFCKFTRRT